jgi:hypothetical protein
MEKERCHGCDKWFAWIEQHLTYHNHCRAVMAEHACQQRLIVECRNCNNGMDPLIVGRSDTNEGRTLKESHTYEKHPT